MAKNNKVFQVVVKDHKYPNIREDVFVNAQDITDACAKAIDIMTRDLAPAIAATRDFWVRRACFVCEVKH